MAVTINEESSETVEQNRELLRVDERPAKWMDKPVGFSQDHSLLVHIALIWRKILTDKIATFTLVSMSKTSICTRGFKRAMVWGIRKILLIRHSMAWASIRPKSTLVWTPIFHLVCLCKVKLAHHRALWSSKGVGSRGISIATSSTPRAHTTPPNSSLQISSRKTKPTCDFAVLSRHRAPQSRPIIVDHWTSKKVKAWLLSRPLVWFQRGSNIVAQSRLISRAFTRLPSRSKEWRICRLEVLPKVKVINLSTHSIHHLTLAKANKEPRTRRPPTAGGSISNRNLIITTPRASQDHKVPQEAQQRSNLRVQKPRRRRDRKAPKWAHPTKVSVRSCKTDIVKNPLIRLRDRHLRRGSPKNDLIT